MEKEKLKAILANSTRDEVEDYCLKLITEKAELEKDLQTVGNVMIELMQTVGVMDKNFKMETESSVIVKRAGSLMTKSMIGRQSFIDQFAFLAKAEPLLDKYEHLLLKK